jgi:hypothetical protein
MKLRNEAKSELNKGTEIFTGNSEPDILKVECSEESISAFLSDGRTINIPKAWYKPFREATIQQLSSYKILPQKKTVYFSEVDEYLPVRVFTHGLGNSCC